MADTSPTPQAGLPGAPSELQFPPEVAPVPEVGGPGTYTPGSGGGLASRTFVGLLIAQFFAAFNDQALHAAAMFFAINTHTLSEAKAISLMPILFYAPWAVFCTIAGFLADRYGKRDSLVAWKLAEVGITALALAGFWYGTRGAAWGPWVVLATVFLMGTHSAFFVPAKYGVMPEVLPPDQLSRGNGVLESLSFLAVILGTVFGGALSYLYLGREWVIGLVLFALAAVGAAASLLIRPVPAANPGRPFPRYVYGPLAGSLRTLTSTRALRTALVGLAFFTFVVAFMRASVYMLGEAQNPRWDELKTSVVVGCVALGIGLGSPLAGWLSGRRIALGLVKFGAAGMVLACLAAGYFVGRVGPLVGCIAAIGFFTGFYIVPLFTLLQHEAPRASKGEMIATSNFVNVTGAILASLLFYGVVEVAERTGLTPAVADRREVAAGTLRAVELYRGRPVHFEVVQAGPGREPGEPEVRAFGDKPAGPPPRLGPNGLLRRVFGTPRRAEPGADTIVEVARGVEPGQPVVVTRYDLSGVTHYDVRPAGAPLDPDYDQRHLPRFLFWGAAGMTLVTLLVLWRPIDRLRRG
ncbi:MAG: MFS transporter [Gemmataceae bacterium]|nr:MFS transporter [Gemmataceae bacterium]